MISNQATITKMQEMRMHGMARAFQRALEAGLQPQFTADELLAHLVDAEWDDRRYRKQERLRKAAHFRYEASFEEFDFSAQRNLEKNTILRLSDCTWVRDHKDILITGPTGIGKSFLGSALGSAACEAGYKVYYQLAGRLMGTLKEAKRTGSYLKVLAKITKPDVLILEDFGLSPFDEESRLALLDILEDRHGRRSTLFLSQLPVASWHGVIGDSTIADAVMDRIVYGSIRIELKGESFRKKLYQDR
jgi:DNA replication protein DnaC